MKSPVPALAMVLAVVASLGVAYAQTPPADDVNALVSAAKTAAGVDWPGTFLRLCVPPPAAPTGGRGAAAAPAGGQRGAGGAPAGPPARDTWYAEPAKVADNFY